MNESISKMVEKLEKEKREVELYKKEYEIVNKLLYYAMKYDWVKEMVENSNINFGIKEDCSKEEINDYITYIKSFKKRITLSNILEKIDNPLDKAFLLDEIIIKNNRKVD